MSCCNRPNRCQNRRDCPARIERIRFGRRMLKQNRPRVFLPHARLALGLVILLAILLVVQYRGALMSMACTTT